MLAPTLLCAPRSARRLVAALIACLLALATFAGPARADHDQTPVEGDVPAYDETADGEWWEEEGPGTPPSVLADPAPGVGALPGSGEGEPPRGDAEEDVDDVEEWDIPAKPWRPPGSSPTRPAAPAPIPTGPTIAGKTARVRSSGKAAVPRGAPKRVRAVIAAANRIVGKPYKWGGGHGRLHDSGYDCSGSVGYALIRAGLMGSPMVSGQMAHWSSRGAGRWITVYATGSHVYMEVAGLRLDTSPVADPTGRRGVRWRPAIGRRPGFTARHPAGL